MKRGLTGSWDMGFILPCSVVKDKDGFHMWYIGAADMYSAAHKYSLKIGYATSDDGINWVKYNMNPLSDLESIWEYGTGSGYPNCHVFKKDDMFHMYYHYGKRFTEYTERENNPESRIGYATSTDGISWNFHPDNPVLKSSFFDWDFYWIGEFSDPPRVLLTDGVHKMWYNFNRKLGYASEELPVYHEKGSGGVFEKRNHLFEELTIPYRLFKPDNYDSSFRYPLVLVLHGSGQRGSNNVAQICDPATTCFSYAGNQEKYPCIVVAPQCPDGTGWSGDILPNLESMLDSVIREFSIDTNRIYVTGYSMGVFGSYNLMKRNPDMFAASVPVAGLISKMQNISDIAHIPLWIFHGSSDVNVDVNESRYVVESMEDLGYDFVYTHARYRDLSTMPDSLVTAHIGNRSDHIYTELFCETHDNINNIVYTNPKVIEWLFSKRKIIRNAIRLTNFCDYRIVSGNETVIWTLINPADSVEIWYCPEDSELWVQVSDVVPNEGSYQWNTKNYADCSFGKLKVLLRDSAGRINGKSMSHTFRINNTPNGKPYIKIEQPDFATLDYLQIKKLLLHLLIGDPESDPLTVRLYFSSDNSASYTLFDTYQASSDTSTQVRWIDFTQFGGTEEVKEARIKATVSDGNSTATDSTFFFRYIPPDPDPIPGAITVAENQEHLKVYPNPAREALYIEPLTEAREISEVKIFSITGNLVLQETGNTREIDLSGFLAGIYFIKISLDDKSYVEKLIIQQ